MNSKTRQLRIRTGLAAALFLGQLAVVTAPAQAQKLCENSRQVGKWEAYGNDFGWIAHQYLDAQYTLNAGDDGMFTDGDAVWVVKGKTAAKVAAITRLAVDGALIAATKPSDYVPFSLDARNSDAAIAAFRKGSSGTISIALEDGSKRELAFDLAGFTRALNVAKRFFADADRGYKARTCKSVF